MLHKSTAGGFAFRKAKRTELYFYNITIIIRRSLVDPCIADCVVDHHKSFLWSLCGIPGGGCLVSWCFNDNNGIEGEFTEGELRITKLIVDNEWVV